MYAVIKTGGKQYRVEAGQVVYIEKLDAQADDTVVFDEVLILNNDKTCKIGKPVIKGATVTGKVIKNGKSKKITVFTYRAKKGSKRKLGHRQPYTKVEITAINEKAPKAEKAEV